MSWIQKYGVVGGEKDTCSIINALINLVLFDLAFDGLKSFSAVKPRWCTSLQPDFRVCKNFHFCEIR